MFDKDTKNVSIEYKTIDEDKRIDGPIRLCDVEDVKFLEGRLKTLIDATISAKDNPDQNKALKDRIRSDVWDFWRLLDAYNKRNIKKASYLESLKEKQNEIEI